MSGDLARVLAAIDTANAEDPTLEHYAGGEDPAALLYGRRMSEELNRCEPAASEHLQIAARGQHVERWKTPRSTYPDGRQGYLAWRKDQAAFHATRVAGMMHEAGYGDPDADRVASMLRKEGLKRDPEVQMLEDVICMTFIRWYLPGFAEGRDPDHVLKIVTKTARKMSAEGRSQALSEFDMPESFAAAFRA